MRFGYANRLGRMAVVFVVCSCAASLLADEWPSPQTREVFSARRDHFVRIVPGESWGDVNGFAGSPKGLYAKATFYHRRSDGAYSLGATVTLLNPVAPADFYVTDQGYLITLDNWHNMGFGKVLALYADDGTPIKSYDLNDLFSDDEIRHFEHSVSSIWWHKGPAYLQTDQKALFISLDNNGTDIVMDAAFGTYRSCKWQDVVHVRDFVCRTSNIGRQWLPY